MQRKLQSSQVSPGTRGRMARRRGAQPFTSPFHSGHRFYWELSVLSIKTTQEICSFAGTCEGNVSLTGSRPHSGLFFGPWVKGHFLNLLSGLKIYPRLLTKCSERTLIKLVFCDHLLFGQSDTGTLARPG